MPLLLFYTCRFVVQTAPTRQAKTCTLFPLTTPPTSFRMEGMKVATSTHGCWHKICGFLNRQSYPFISPTRTAHIVVAVPEMVMLYAN